MDAGPSGGEDPARRERNSTWGPKKLVARLERKFPDEPWPAPSSAGDLLQRAGLVQSTRRRRRPVVHPGRPRVVAEAPNDFWTADYMGQFRTRNRDWCYPLTIADLYTETLFHSGEPTAIKGMQQGSVHGRVPRLFSLWFFFGSGIVPLLERAIPIAIFPDFWFIAMSLFTLFALR